VRAAAPWAGGVAIGGDFLDVSGTPASHVALVLTDGSVLPLGAGLDGRVLALAEHEGGLYAGGEFTASGPVATNRIARWNGASWQPVGGGVNGYVHALASHDGRLFAGGEFTTAGGGAANRVAAWDGAAWAALGGGLEDWVRALHSHAGALYAGGDFGRVGRWDGVAWQNGGAFNGPVFALETHAGELYAGGLFSAAGGHFAPRVARWDGIRWWDVGVGFDNFVWALGSYGGELLAGGAFVQLLDGSPRPYAARWNGVSWASAGPGMSAPVWTMCPIPEGVATGGSFLSPQVRLARWTGEGWGVFGLGGPDGVVRAGCTFDGAIVLGGDFVAVGGSESPGVAAWTGSAWAPMGAGLTSSARVFAFAEYGSELYAGGQVSATGGRIWRWSGAAWVPFATASAGIRDLAVYQGDLVAAGLFRSIGGTNAAGIARWDGVAWHSLPPGPVLPANKAVTSLVEYDGVLVAGGDFLLLGTIPANYVGRWDGTSWAPLGTGLNGRIRDLAVWNGRLIAGGRFTMAGGSPAQRVAAWDGTGWAPLGAGLGRTVRALAVLGGDLVVGGDFSHSVQDTASGLPRAQDVPTPSDMRFVARWGGVRWDGIGGGTNGAIRGLYGTESQLWAGGDFSEAGGVPSRFLALWQEGGTPGAMSPVFVATTAPRLLVDVVVAPNPFAGDTSFRFSLERRGRAALTVFDVAGRRVRLVQSGELPAGIHAIPWDGRVSSGVAAPAGVYFYRLETPAGITSGKLVRRGP